MSEATIPRSLEAAYEQAYRKRDQNSRDEIRELRRFVLAILLSYPEGVRVTAVAQEEATDRVPFYGITAVRDLRTRDTIYKAYREGS